MNEKKITEELKAAGIFSAIVETKLEGTPRENVSLNRAEIV